MHFLISLTRDAARVASPRSPAITFNGQSLVHKANYFAEDTYALHTCFCHLPKLTSNRCHVNIHPLSEQPVNFHSKPNTHHDFLMADYRVTIVTSLVTHVDTRVNSCNLVHFVLWRLLN